MHVDDLFVYKTELLSQNGLLLSLLRLLCSASAAAASASSVALGSVAGVFITYLVLISDCKLLLFVLCVCFLLSAPSVATVASGSAERLSATSAESLALSPATAPTPGVAPEPALVFAEASASASNPGAVLAAGTNTTPSRKEGDQRFLFLRSHI